MSFAKFYLYTPDATKVGSADQTNFAVLVDVTHADLKTVANGGLVTSALGYDIVPYQTNAYATLLAFERLSYDGTTGRVRMWVKQPTVSHTAGIPFVLAYGDATITTDQQNVAGTWEAGLGAVIHGGDGTTASGADSTSNAHNFTLTAAPAATTSPVGGAITFNGTTQYARLAASVKANGLEAAALSCLFRPRVTPVGSVVLVALESSVAIGQAMELGTAAAGLMRAQRGGTGGVVVQSVGAHVVGSWNYGLAVFNTVSDRTIYLEATGVNQTTTVTGPYTADLSYIGVRFANSVLSSFFDGDIAEARFHLVNRDANYATCERNALQSPSTFVVESGPFLSPNTAAVAENAALIAATGGNAAWLGVYDRRCALTIVSAAVSAWDDAIGTTGGRTPGPTLAQATAGSRPALSGVQNSGSEVVTFASASTQHLLSGQDTRFALNASTPLYVVAIAKATGAGYVGGLASDPTSATTYPYCLLQTAVSNWKADYAATASGNRVQPNSTVPFNDGVIRLSIAGKSARVGAAAFANADESYRYYFGGRQPQDFGSSSSALIYPVATTVAGGLKAVLGRLGATYWDGTLYWVGIFAGDLTATVLESIRQFAVTSHGAALLSDKRGTFIWDGNSLAEGLTSTDPQTYLEPSGSKAPITVAAALNTGSRGTFAAQGLDVGTTHSYNYAVAGRTTQGIYDLFDLRVAACLDSRRTGPFVYGLWEISNSVNHDLLTAAQMLTLLAALKAKVVALGGKMVLATCVDRTNFYTTGTLNSVGIAARDTNVGLRASPSTYCDLLIDIEADASNKFLINRAVSFAYTDAAVYSDGTHLTDAGYATVGAIMKTAFDANDGIFWGSASRSRHRRASAMLRLTA